MSAHPFFRWPVLLALLLCAVGVGAPLWPLSLIGLLLSAAVGPFALTIVMGVVMDAVFGVPYGFFAWIPLPFTALALAGIALRIGAPRYMRATGKIRF